MVGSTIGSKLVALGHEVVMGSRKAGNEKAVAWAAAAGAGASHGTFADAAAHGELVFNCTSGAGAVDAVTAAGADNLRGKILIDIAIPLDFSKGMPPSLLFSGDDFIGERDPARVAGHEGRQGAQHDQPQGDGGPKPRARRPRPLHQRQ